MYITFILYCYIVLGTQSNDDNVQTHTLADSSNGFLTRNITILHERKLFVSIKCINNVELETIYVAEPVTLALESPESSLADLQFIPYDVHQMPIVSKVHSNGFDTEAIQSSRSRLSFHWMGFEDQVGIDRYEYRVTSEKTSLNDWTSVGKRTLVTLDNLKLLNGEVYTAEVRAVNKGDLRSNPVNTTLLVDSQLPGLTGKLMC